jgi:hypothetical protein
MNSAAWRGAAERIALSPFGTTANKAGYQGALAWGRAGGTSAPVVMWPQGVRTGFTRVGGFYGTSGIFPWYGLVSGWPNYL